MGNLAQLLVKGPSTFWISQVVEKTNTIGPHGSGSGLFSHNITCFTSNIGRITMGAASPAGLDSDDTYDFSVTSNVS